MLTNHLFTSFFLAYTTINQPVLVDNISTLPMEQQELFIEGLRQAEIAQHEDCTTPFKAELIAAIALAKTAGYKTLEVRESGSLQVSDKEEDYFEKQGISKKNITPVTVADLKANIIICLSLRHLFPEYGICSEETIPCDEISRMTEEPWHKKRYVFMIDPLDGTKEFIKGTNDYTVNIALLENGLPVVGVTHLPAQNTTYWAVKNQGAYRQIGNGPIVQLSLDPDSNDGSIKVLVSRNTIPTHSKNIYQLLFQPCGEEQGEFDSYFDGLCSGADIINVGKNAFIRLGSAGVKLSKMSEGVGNLYMLSGQKNEKIKYWDVASSHIIVEEVGGKVTDLNGDPIVYLPMVGENGEVLNPNQELICGFIASLDEKIHNATVEAAKITIHKKL